VSGGDLEQLLFPIFNPKSEVVADKLTTGLPAGPGAAVGKIVFHAHEAEAMVKADPKAKLILVRHETSPRRRRRHVGRPGHPDLHGRHDLARGRGRARLGQVLRRRRGSLQIDYDKKARSAAATDPEGGRLDQPERLDRHRLCGADSDRGQPGGRRPWSTASRAKKHPIYKMYKQVSDWADQYRKIKVRTNADTPKDAQIAIQVRRRRHRPLPHRAHVLRRRPHLGQARVHPRRDQEAREKALAKLLPYQRGDFEGIFEAMDGLPGHDPPARSAAA
jgi:pyruvate,orthophosphate dikinase